MNKNDFELLQPVAYGHVTGYISFISEEYITICFKDIPLPKSANSRWGRHYVNILVYPQFWHEVRSRLDETEEEGFETLVQKKMLSLSLKKAREFFEREYIKIQMKRFNNNVSRTANFIGMERSALHRKLKNLKLN